MKNTLIIIGHPDPESLNHALAEAYRKGLEIAGNNFKKIDLSELKFDPVLKFGYRKKMALEPDLLNAQQLIKEADHLVFFYPLWWGFMPAILKGFFDRILLPGFAYKFLQNGRWLKLLKNKTAHLIVTMDSPPLYYTLRYRDAGIKVFKNGILKFCGINKTKVTKIGSVRFSSENTKQKWFKKIEILGKKIN